jgi:hypothetical protein
MKSKLALVRIILVLITLLGVAGIALDSISLGSKSSATAIAANGDDSGSLSVWGDDSAHQVTALNPRLRGVEKQLRKKAGSTRRRR